MTDARSRIEPASPPPKGGDAVGAHPDRHGIPARPSTASANGAPVLIKATAPLSIRLSQLLWILSFAVGGFTLVYFFVVRNDLLPLIIELAKKVTPDRSDEVYATAADIIFWVVFGLMTAVLLTQITLLVSFMNRRPQIRWWQLLTLVVLALLVVLSPEWVALGDKGRPVQPMLAAQTALVLLALLFSVLPRALAWSARRYDVRRGPQGPGSTGDL